VVTSSCQPQYCLLYSLHFLDILSACFFFSYRTVTQIAGKRNYLELYAAHAVSTYRQFIIENAAQLKRLPAPKIARQYYINEDPYLFDMDSALARGPTSASPRMPPCETLYDVFTNILEDEWVCIHPE
jgi:hypothetical protein